MSETQYKNIYSKMCELTGNVMHPRDGSLTMTVCVPLLHMNLTVTEGLPIGSVKIDLIGASVVMGHETKACQVDFSQMHGSFIKSFHIMVWDEATCRAWLNSPLQKKHPCRTKGLMYTDDNPS